MLETALKRAFWSLDVDSVNEHEAVEAIYAELNSQSQVPIGLFADVSKASLKRWLGRWFQECASDGLNPTKSWIQLYLGRAPEFEDDAILLDPILLKIGEHEVSLEGPLERIHPDRHTIMAITTKKQPDHGDFLKCFLTILALSARRGPAAPDSRHH